MNVGEILRRPLVTSFWPLIDKSDLKPSLPEV